MQDTPTGVADGRPLIDPPFREHHQRAAHVTGLVVAGLITAALLALGLSSGAIAVLLFSDGGMFKGLWAPAGGLSLWCLAAASAAGWATLQRLRRKRAVVAEGAALFLTAPLLALVFWCVCFA